MATPDIPTRRRRGTPAPEPSPPTLQAALMTLPVYPLRGRGIALLLVGTFLLWIVGFLPWFGWVLRIMMMMYIIAFFWDVVRASANGDDELPPWPDITDIFSDIVRPAVMFLVCHVVCMLPALVVIWAWNPSSPIRLGVMGIGVVYLPMAMLAVALFDSMAAASPTIVVPAILKIPMQYILLVAVIAAVSALSVVVHDLTAEHLPILNGVVAAFLFIYEGALIMRVLGVLYHAHARQIGWFHRERGVCPDCGFDLRGLRPRSGAVCPECGEALSDKIIATIRPA